MTFSHSPYSSQPAYLYSALHALPSTCTRSLRFSNTNLLSVLFVRTLFGARSFSVAAPIIWNSLPPAPSYPLNAFLLVPQICLLLTIVRVYKLYLLTSLFNC